MYAGSLRSESGQVRAWTPRPPEKGFHVKPDTATHAPVIEGACPHSERGEGRQSRVNVAAPARGIGVPVRPVLYPRVRHRSRVWPLTDSARMVSTYALTAAGDLTLSPRGNGRIDQSASDHRCLATLSSRFCFSLSRPSSTRAPGLAGPVRTVSLERASALRLPPRRHGPAPRRGQGQLL